MWKTWIGRNYLNAGKSTICLICRQHYLTHHWSPTHTKINYPAWHVRASQPIRPHRVLGRQMCMLELFSGCSIVSQKFHELGWRIRSVDNDTSSNATDKVDIMKLRFEDIGMVPDFIWASRKFWLNAVSRDLFADANHSPLCRFLSLFSVGFAQEEKILSMVGVGVVQYVWVIKVHLTIVRCSRTHQTRLPLTPKTTCSIIVASNSRKR